MKIVKIRKTQPTTPFLNIQIKLKVIFHKYIMQPSPSTLKNSKSFPTKMCAVNPIAHYFYAIKCFLEEWEETFRDYDINDYLYDDKENAVYSMLDKFYTRVRIYKHRIPQGLCVKGLPTLRTLESDFMYEDSDLHLSDYESSIYDPLKRIYELRAEYSSFEDSPEAEAAAQNSTNEA